MLSIFLMFEMFQEPMSPLKEEAPWNMRHILATCETSQEEMSSLKPVLSRNNSDMSMTFEMHHEFIGQPYVCPISHWPLVTQSSSMVY